MLYMRHVEYTSGMSHTEEVCTRRATGFSTTRLRMLAVGCASRARQKRVHTRAHRQMHTGAASTGAYIGVEAREVWLRVLARAVQNIVVCRSQMLQVVVGCWLRLCVCACVTTRKCVDAFIVLTVDIHHTCTQRRRGGERRRKQKERRNTEREGKERVLCTTEDTYLARERYSGYSTAHRTLERRATTSAGRVRPTLQRVLMLHLLPRVSLVSTSVRAPQL